jgi:O-antigen/teichoic acid export membrane protein
MTDARRALIYSFMDRYSGMLIAIGSSMVLARLLTPAEVGTFSVAMGLLAFAAMFRDLGAGQYLLQERELTDDRVRAVWALQLGLGLLLALIVLGLAYPAAWFFKQDALLPIFGVLALTYLLNPFGSLTYAWLMRNMRFGALALMRLSSAGVGAAVAILLAWLDHGAISLAWGNLAGIAAQSLVAVCYRPQHFPWRPGTRELRRVLGFGSRVTGSGVLNTLRDYLPEIVIARVQDVTAAGYFSRANGLVAMFARLVMDATNAVAQALFAQRARAGADLAEPLHRALSYVTVLAWSFAALLGLLAEPLIALLYGSQWGDSVAPMRWLALGLAFSAPIGICSALLLAAGGTHLMLRLAAAGAALVVLAALLGAPYGLVATCAALAAGQALAGALWVQQSCRFAKLPLRRLLSPLLRGLGVALFSALPLVAALVSGWVGQGPALLVLMVCGMAAALGFVLAVLLFGHPIRQ